MFSFCGEEQNEFEERLFSCLRDGLTIRGTEYRPQGDRLPIAIVSHGFMANQKTVRHYAKLLARKGFAAFVFDFSGGCVAMGESDGKTTEMSALTEVKDLMAVIEYTKSLPYVDPARVLLLGCSQGGFVSALTAARLKEQIAGLVLFYPAFCIPDDARAGKMMWAKFDPADPPEVIRCGPMKLGKCYVNDVVDMDPFEEIKDYPGDVLIVHGTEDKIVHPSYSERAREVYLSRTSGTVELLFIDGGSHGFSKEHDAIARRKLKEWL